MKYMFTVLACAMVAGCTTTSPDAHWTALTSGTPAQRLDALRQLERKIRRRMSEKDVRALFPPGALVKRPTQDEGYVLTLSDDLSAKVLTPHSPGAIFGIEFDQRSRVIRHWLALRPEM